MDFQKLMKVPTMNLPQINWLHPLFIALVNNVLSDLFQTQNVLRKFIILRESLLDSDKSCQFYCFC